MRKIMIMIIIIVVFNVVQGSFEIAPPIQTINLDKPLTESYIVRNTTNSLVKINVYSERPKNQVSESLYMGEWIVVYPKIIYLKPFQKKTVRIAARAPRDLIDGEYRSILIFEELPNETYTTNESTGPTLRINQMIASSIYGEKGILEYKGELENEQTIEKDGKVFLEMDIINKGNVTIDPVFKFYQNEEFLFEIEGSKVIRENKTTYSLELKKLPLDFKNVKMVVEEVSGIKILEKNF